MMNLAGAKRADKRPWSWKDVFPPRSAPQPRGAPAKAPRAPAAKANPLKVFRFWKTGKVPKPD